MSLKIIGSGFGRTGTMSTKMALEALGFGPCHHMVEVMSRPESVDGWAAAIEGRDVDLDGLVAGFRSAVDFPSCAVWSRLADRYPDAKVLLTVRSPESWWTSFEATIGPRIDATDQGEGQSMMTAIRERVFGGRPLDRDHAVAVFEAHNADVVRRTPAERLLVYEVGSGWEPLCAFLGVPVPDEPFPRSNATAEFQERARSKD